MGITKITRNYQITLPRDVREVEGLNEGDEVIFSFEGDKVIVQKVRKDPVMAAAGVWKDIKESGAQYQKRMRLQWKRRQKALKW